MQAPSAAGAVSSPPKRIETAVGKAKKKKKKKIKCPVCLRGMHALRQTLQTCIDCNSRVHLACFTGHTCVPRAVQLANAQARAEKAAEAAREAAYKALLANCG